MLNKAILLISSKLLLLILSEIRAYKKQNSLRNYVSIRLIKTQYKYKKIINKIG
jgi:hypothetical protein